ncbi:hypothetical protein [Celerinatantimonas diazotrophica]|uniref:Uncharacterized protein n=1 Tax=Celerinatantimonas diazotrophica TaxID=412034 RepID=A0A4R1JA80_9GAMM|nr:hypothetical protein [Celerinatantimonas diazotrophica]TCK47377.1 hypothetical protein EV690_2399 [Celerinatantimonas diazotrophica]CAG9295005.1 hypothetical protein CEDIAZO_00111 [Celerinatantimonas diazotrophica]
MTSFSKLCLVTLEHEYFTGQTPELFDWQPTPECAQLLKHMRCHYKIRNNQLLLFCESHASHNEQAVVCSRLLTMNQALTFTLYRRYNMLTEISAFPDNLGTKILVNFRNDDVITNDTGCALAPVTDADWQTSTYWPILSSRNFFWPFHSSEQQAGSEWTLKSLDTQQICDSQVIQTTPKGLQVNLGNSQESYAQNGPGQYELALAQVPQAQFYIDDRLLWRTPFAVLTLKTGSLTPTKGQFVIPETGVVSYKSFNLTIPARRTWWRYLVTASYLNHETLGDLSIQVPDQCYTFAVSTTPTGWQCLADQPLTLSSQGRKHLTLNSSKQGTLIDNLPSPNPTQLVVEPDAAYSDMYIYI